MAMGILENSITTIAALTTILAFILPNIQAGFSHKKPIESSAPVLSKMYDDIISATDKVSSLVLLEEYDNVARKLYIKAGYRVKDDAKSFFIVTAGLFIISLLFYVILAIGAGNSELNYLLLVDLIVLLALWLYAWGKAMYRSIAYQNKYRKVIKEFRKEINPETKRTRVIKDTLDYRTIRIGLMIFGVSMFILGMFTQRFLPLF